MNDYTTLLMATGRMDDRLREAEQRRLARLAADHGAPSRVPAAGSLRRQIRRFGRAFGNAGRRRGRGGQRIGASSTEVCAC